VDQGSETRKENSLFKAGLFRRETFSKDTGQVDPLGTERDQNKVMMPS
jgi:hypothetical protein